MIEALPSGMVIAAGEWLEMQKRSRRPRMEKPAHGGYPGVVVVRRIPFAKWQESLLSNVPRPGEHAFTCLSCGGHSFDWRADVWYCSACGLEHKKHPPTDSK